MSETNSIAPSTRADTRLVVSSFSPSADYRDQEQVAIYAGKDATLIATTGNSRDPLAEDRARKLVADPDFKRLVESRAPEAKEALGVGTHIDGQGGVRLPEQMSALSRPGSEGAPDVVIAEHGADHGKDLAESLAQSASIQSALAQAAPERSTFEIPPDMAKRYSMRVVESPDGGNRRLGVFFAGDRLNPSLEIIDDRIIARDEDPETIAALVRLAQHNGWETIDVHGTPEFTKAVWEAGSRAGLTVKGYEPSFAEAERMAGLRSREEERRQEAATRGAPANAAQTAERAVQAMETVASAASESDGAVGSPEVDASAQRRPSPAAAREAGERAALDERAIVERVFDRGIRELETSGDPRARAVRETASALVDQIYGAQEERAVARSTRDQDRQPQPERDAQVVREERQRSEEAKRHRDSEELADLFLHGAADTIAAEPRLANALQAQAAMEQHIAEVFKGDAMQVASETRDSRQMISDVLRRGLDVSVREPAPVRRIEPVQSSPTLER